MRATAVTRIIRALLGLGYIAAAVFHLVNLLRWDPARTYEGFADTARWPWLELFIRDVAVVHPTPFTVAIGVIVLAVGVLILSKDRFARLGHLVGIAFNLALIPTLSAPYWFGNVVLIVLHLLCAVTRFQDAPASSATRDVTATT